MDIEDNKIKPIGEMLQDKIHRLKKENFKLQARTDRLTVELEKADTVIDLMAEHIASLDIDEDICMKNVTNTELCNEEYSNCKECIKQYFYKKAEEK